MKGAAAVRARRRQLAEDFQKGAKFTKVEEVKGGGGKQGTSANLHGEDTLEAFSVVGSLPGTPSAGDGANSERISNELYSELQKTKEGCVTLKSRIKTMSTPCPACNGSHEDGLL